MKKRGYGIDLNISSRRVTENDSTLLKRFQCENPSIEHFVHVGCLESKSNVTYLFIDEDVNRVIGICAIGCSGISTIEDNGGSFYRTMLPSIEINYFAIDEDYRSLLYDKDSNRYDTLSKALFLRMLAHIKHISEEHVGATHASLYAVPRAASFYKRCGFEDFDSFMEGDGNPYLRDCVPMYYIL